MGAHPSETAWRRFWERGGWWRAVLLAAVYLALYEGLSLAFVPLAAGIDDPSGPAGVLVYYVLPIAVGIVLLLAFALSTGWLRELFGRQPIGGRGWMWIAVGVVLAFNLLRFATIDYREVGVGLLATWLLAGLAIGLAEELLTRGLVVTLLRRRGYREIVVAVVSAAIFAGLHAVNLLGGQSLVPTLLQLVYTFAFGICMYLALRASGTLIVPILLHATTDPGIFLQSAHPVEGGLSAVAGLGNIVVIAVGLVLLLFIRGQVQAAPPQSIPGGPS